MKGAGRKWVPDAQTIQQAMVGAIGTIPKYLVSSAMMQLASASGLTNQNATYRVLWGGSPNNGLTEKGVPTVVVAAITPDGGGPYVVTADAENEVAEGVMGAPAISFATWRNDASYRGRRGGPATPGCS